MRVWKAVVLFLLGFFLALFAFPVAWATSALLGYLFAIAGIVIGAYMVAKRESAKLPLILGVVLMIFSLLALLGTFIVHIALWSLAEAAREASKVVNLTGTLGRGVKAGDWVITAVDVREAAYIRSDSSYYKAKEGHKLVVVRLRVENVGRETNSPPIYGFVLVTDARRSYERIYPFSLDFVWRVSDEVVKSAVEFRALDTTARVAPGSAAEGDVLFQIPTGERPERLHIRTGIVGGYEIVIKFG
ncbi:DUF4352 domain-containing protein [Pyrobaculum islandicum]|nr:DUF4352 domain-containing protein [Pyrobaculum islandicum]